jgi:hypothetical protein
MKSQPFNQRAKAFIQSVVKQRLHLIRTDTKRYFLNESLRVSAELVRNNIPFMVSDQAVASYLVRNSDRIFSLIPRNAKFKFSKRESEFRQLLSEAREITQMNPQNLVK